MSISRQNLSIVIVTLKSENVIHECIKSLNQDLPIIVVENSNNLNFKKDLESKYKNLKCILSKSNLGMGAANNIGINLATTNYVLLLNPDVILKPNSLDEIFSASKELSEFSILSPISNDNNYPNYGMINKKDKILTSKNSFEVDYVDGYSMLLNKSKFSDKVFFDENIFLYLENNDLCLRVKRKGGSIFVIPNSKISHSGSKAVDFKFKNEVELSRNWHWVWSKFYFNKKNFGYFKALKECSLIYLSELIKFTFYLIIGNKFKRKIYYNRASGFYNSLLAKSSWYRPNLKD
jgi:N-acetylglucosaminyl-diphospho-decaprenol L-rhamnosyltransferase